ncbi:MAG: hypothetical protein IT305_13765 [Chloroflexi bacterium]|nr:hypothetical protein [Chloroflexota bacterium]
MYYARDSQPATSVALSGPTVTPLEFLWRWWWLFLFGMLLGAGGAYEYLQFAPTWYQSTALVMVNTQQPDPEGGLWLTSNPGRLQSATQLLVNQATSPPVYASVSAALPDLGISPSDVADLVVNKRVDVHQQDLSNFISVSVTDRDPERAARLTDGYARGLVDNVNVQMRQVAERRRAELTRQIELTQQQILALPPRSLDPSVNSTIATIYSNLLQNVIASQLSLESIDRTLSPVAQYSAASDAISTTNVRRIALAGVATGGAVALAFAVLFEWIRQRRIQARERLARQSAHARVIPFASRATLRSGRVRRRETLPRRVDVVVVSGRAAGGAVGRDAADATTRGGVADSYPRKAPDSRRHPVGVR